MNHLREAIEFSRTQQLKAKQIAEVEIQRQREAEEAKARAEHEATERAFSESQGILDQAQVPSVLDEINQELFKGTGKFFSNRWGDNVWRIDDRGTKSLIRAHYVTLISLAGRIGKTPALLIAEANIQKPNGSDPILKISCYTEVPKGRLGILRRGIQWENKGENTVLKTRIIKGQDEPTREWQDVNQVRQAFAKVIVAKGLA